MNMNRLLRLVLVAAVSVSAVPQPADCNNDCIPVPPPCASGWVRYVIFP